MKCRKHAADCRSSHRRCSVRKGVLRNFTKLTGKQLRQRLFFNKIKKESLAQVFSCEFCKNSQEHFFTEYLRSTATATEMKTECY